MNTQKRSRTMPITPPTHLAGAVRLNASKHFYRLAALLAGATLLLVILLAAPAEARQEGEPFSYGVAAKSLEALEVHTLSSVAVKALLEEDADAKAGPLRYALPETVQITPATHGTWEDRPDGGRLWRLRVQAPGATDLNFGFSRFAIPPGAKLYIVSEDETYFQGPYGFEDVRAHGEFWSPVVPGERAVLEFYLPAETKPGYELELTHVGLGYRDLFKRLPPVVLTKQGSCNIDVVCPEGDGWRDQIRSVAVYSTGGSLFCTGQMIADVPGSFRPFFLTANHCGMSAGNAPSMVVYWNYESASCGDLSGGSLDDNQTGATFRAAREDVDFALLELDADPDPAFGVYFTGWDRTEVAPFGSVAIHHPSTDEKAISFNDDVLTTDATCIGGASTADSHWWVDNWEQGTTEPGSSGSGLWHPDNGKLIGFLSGGLASCSNINYDCYGRFSVAWDGASASSRLRDWLDPSGTDTMMVAGSDPLPRISYESHQGTDTCPSNSANENGLFEPGETLELAVTIRGSGDFTQVTGTLTSPTPGVTILDGTADFPDISSGASVVSTAPHFTVRLETSVACLSSVDFALSLDAAEGGPFDAAFSNAVGAPLTPDVPVAIPDNGDAANPGVSTLVVGQDVTLTDMDVRVEIAHSWVGDLEVTLSSPAGTEVTLLDRPGTTGSGTGCSNNDMNVTFDDASAFDLEPHCAGTTPWYEGVASPVDALSGLNGESTLGTWTLRVSDYVGQDTGSIIDWELLSTPAVTGTCSVCAAEVLFEDSFDDGTMAAWSTTVP